MRTWGGVGSKISNFTPHLRIGRPLTPAAKLPPPAMPPAMQCCSPRNDVLRGRRRHEWLCRSEATAGGAPETTSTSSTASSPTHSSSICGQLCFCLALRCCICSSAVYLRNQSAFSQRVCRCMTLCRPKRGQGSSGGPFPRWMLPRVRCQRRRRPSMNESPLQFRSVNVSLPCRVSPRCSRSTNTASIHFESTTLFSETIPTHN